LARKLPTFQVLVHRIDVQRAGHGFLRILRQRRTARALLARVGGGLRFEVRDRLLQRNDLGMFVRVLQQQLVELATVLGNPSVGRARGGALLEQPERRNLAIELLRQLDAPLFDQTVLGAQLEQFRLGRLQARVVVAGLARQQADVVLLELGETILGFAQARLVFANLLLQELLRRVGIGALDAERVLDEGVE
jgi:hypothetical protein